MRSPRGSRLEFDAVRRACARSSSALCFLQMTSWSLRQVWKASSNSGSAVNLRLQRSMMS
eukprot:15484642-Alexandrium_andersonii.AAC.1